jgi:arylsulfatase A-like enzyme
MLCSGHEAVSLVAGSDVGAAAGPQALLVAWAVSFGLALGILLGWTAFLTGPLLVACGNRPAGECVERAGRRFIDWLRVRPNEPERVGAILGLAVTLALFAAASFGTSLFCIKTFHEPVPAAGAAACFALASLLVAWLVGRLVRAGAVLLGGFQPFVHPWYSMASALVLVLASLAAVIAFAAARWDYWLPEVRVGHFVHAAVGLALHAGFATLILYRGRETGPRPGRESCLLVSKVGGRWLTPVLTLAAVCMFVTVVWPGGVSSDTQVRDVVLGLDGQTRVWMDVVRVASDFDSDGSSNLVGGGDCEPFNAGISPGMTEIPDNGIDEDCFGGDSTVASLSLDQTPGWYSGEGLATRPYNVLLIGGDGISWSRTSLAGYSRDTMPFLARWAAERGTVFEKAFCSVPYTGFSHLSLFTGMMPLSIAPLGPGASSTSTLPKSSLTLAEYLKGRGYRTMAVDTAVKRWAPWVTRGFDSYKYSYKAGAREVSEWLLAALDGIGEASPFFAFAFYFDAHFPYTIPDMEGTQVFGDTLPDEYDRRLRYWDARLEELFEKLQPYLQDTIVIFYSDHGERLREGGLLGHGNSLLDADVHVPLVISVPGLAPRRIKQPVSLADVRPTLVNFLSGGGSADSFDGKSLARQIITGVESKARLIHFQTYRKQVRYGVTDGRYKAVYDVQNNKTRVFDLVDDPDERAPLNGKRKEVELTMERSVREYVAARMLHWQAIERKRVQADAPPSGMDTPLAAFGGLVSLMGARTVKEAGATWIEMYFRCDGVPDRDYAVTVHALHAKSKKFCNLDHKPASLAFGTGAWVPGKTYLDRFQFRSGCGAFKDNDVWIGFHAGRTVLPAASSVLPLDKKRVLLNAALPAPVPKPR